MAAKHKESEKDIGSIVKTTEKIPLVEYKLVTGWKSLDVIASFFGFMIANVLLFLLYSFLMSFLFTNIISNVPSIMFGLTLFAINVFIVVYLFRAKYKFLAIGLLTSIFLPLLIFGSCIGIMSLILSAGPALS
ncbi:MAG: hypothetical protein WC755_00970 [Candidatus Woesearchaeota archaeon]|jgi:hypothetical protein